MTKKNYALPFEPYEESLPQWDMVNDFHDKRYALRYTILKALGMNQKQCEYWCNFYFYKLPKEIQIRLKGMYR